jgi:very-short-patch-repair endonuclease
MIDRARKVRREDTPPEQLLWNVLRNGQIGGLKFRRQHPIGPYVVDFYCHGIGLVVEVDGMSHDNKALKDAGRAAYFSQQGLRVLCVMNEDVTRDLDAVAREIARVGGVSWD